MKILYVEDDPVNRHVMRAMMSRVGSALVEAENGQLGLNAVESEDFDLILMDLRMPVMDGLSALRHIRKRPDAKRSLPVIIVTADVTDEARHECKAAGADDVFYKPVCFKALLALIAQYTVPRAAA